MGNRHQDVPKRIQLGIPNLGLSGISLQLKTGRRITVGTDDPDGLQTAIVRAMYG